MKTLFILLISITLAGCALSYANHSPAGDGQYIISASGNSKDNKKTLLKTISKRALKLCGNENYKFLNDTEVVNSTVATGNLLVPNAPVRTLSRHVQCEK